MPAGETLAIGVCQLGAGETVGSAGAVGAAPVLSRDVVVAAVISCAISEGNRRNPTIAGNRIDPIGLDRA